MFQWASRVIMDAGWRGFHKLTLKSCISPNKSKWFQAGSADAACVKAYEGQSMSIVHVKDQPIGTCAITPGSIGD